MKTVFLAIFFLLFIIFCSSVTFSHAAAQQSAIVPLITLRAENKPLGEILEGITRDTGYRFKLNRAWSDYPVSASVTNLQIESVLKRLLRDLNHTITWESDMTATIMILSKAAPIKPGNRPAPLPLPAQIGQKQRKPAAEPQNGSAEETSSGAVEAEGEGGEAVTPDDPKADQDQPADPSADSSEYDPSATEEPTAGIKIEN